jgi:hypothetical protein
MEKQPPINALVPMVHVADVERSVTFYQLLGFEVGNRVPPTGAMGWCWLYQPKAPDWKRGANLMLSRGECAIDPKQQEVLFYLYAPDLVALRKDLIAQGATPGEITFPEYLPKGELRLTDPDGYCLMIAQASADTP